MGYESRTYAVGRVPLQLPQHVVITKGDSWIEDHYVDIPALGGFTTADAVDKVVVQIRSHADDEEPALELTSTPAAGVTVSRPSPDRLKFRTVATPLQTAGLALNVPEGGRVPGTPAPPQPVLGAGSVGYKVYLATGYIFTLVRGVLITQESIVH